MLYYVTDLSGAILGTFESIDECEYYLPSMPAACYIETESGQIMRSLI
jgi:hypothetical protein